MSGSWDFRQEKKVTTTAVATVTEGKKSHASTLTKHRLTPSLRRRSSLRWRFTTAIIRTSLKRAAIETAAETMATPSAPAAAVIIRRRQILAAAVGQ